MRLAKVDENGYFVEDVVVKEFPKVNKTVEVEDEEGDLIEREITVNDSSYVSKPSPGNLVKPKWNGEEWVEGATQAEIDTIEQEKNNRPQTVEERVDKLEKATGSNNKSSEKGIASRLDELESRIKAIEDAL